MVYRLFFGIAFFLCLSILKPHSRAQEQHIDLTSLSIEELMEINITSVGKKSQHLSSSAAAIHVITAEDIKTYGVTSIADALRMVPGLHIGRIHSDKWAIDSRSAASRFASKLLVLMDGRSVYSPSFSGVYWEIQDTLLSDIERIEVIRGPGATLWGANAVNGVINIMTKSSRDTHGGLVEVGAGNLEKRFASARYGMKLSDNTHLRLYGKGFDRGGFTRVDDNDENSGWQMFRSGFRMDGDITRQDTFTVQGDIYQGDIEQYLENLPTLPASEMENPVYAYSKEDTCDVSGGNMTARWQRILSSSSEWTLQAYYDRTSRKEAFIQEKRDTFDIEWQHRFSPLSGHDVVWGVGYNHTRDHFTDTFIINLENDRRNDDLLNAFLQDEITLIPHTLKLTVGSKLEHNDYSGYEIQPSIRLFWDIDTRNKLWLAVSRAIRSPSRVDHDGRIVQQVAPPLTLTLSDYIYTTNPLPVVFNLKGGDWFESERLMAYEMGYRLLATRDFTFDLALYYQDYDHLRQFNAGEIIIHDTWIEQVVISENSFSGTSYGGELTAAWQPQPWLKLDLGYSWLKSDLDGGRQVGEEPNHQFSLRTLFTPHEHVDLNLRLRYVDDFNPNFSTSPDGKYPIDSYFALDINLIWGITPNVEFSLSLQNLMDNAHLECVQESWIMPAEVKRSIYAKIAWSL